MNKKLQESPEELNATNAEDSAWLIKVTVTKEDQLKDLMTKAQYDKFLESEKGHWLGKYEWVSKIINPYLNLW